MKRIGAGLVALAVLAACQDTADRPPQPVEADRMACDDRGGTYTRVGLLQQWACVVPTPDAGKSCTLGTQCTSMCLDDDMEGPGQCAPVTPMFGCHILIENDGQHYEICID